MEFHPKKSSPDFTNQTDVSLALERLFFKRVNAFPEPAQEYIGLISSNLLEPDIEQEYLSNQDKQESVYFHLLANKVSVEDAGIVMNFFGFSYKGMNARDTNIDTQAIPVVKKD